MPTQGPGGYPQDNMHQMHKVGGTLGSTGQGTCPPGLGRSVPTGPCRPAPLSHLTAAGVLPHFPAGQAGPWRAASIPPSLPTPQGYSATPLAASAPSWHCPVPSLLQQGPHCPPAPVVSLPSGQRWPQAFCVPSTLWRSGVLWWWDPPLPGRQGRRAPRLPEAFASGGLSTGQQRARASASVAGEGFP